VAATLVNTQSRRVERSDRLAQWHTKDRRPIARETKFCTGSHTICGSSDWNSHSSGA